MNNISHFKSNNKERIAKRISRLGYCSRREAEKLILQKKVKVDGVLIDTPAFFVDKSNQVIVDGNPLVLSNLETKLYLYHKPTGELCTKSDPLGRKTIYDTLSYKYNHLIYVGRLDLSSEGLLLLTNSGELSHKLTLPKFQITRVYKVRAYGKIDESIINYLSSGVTIGNYKYQPITTKILGNKKKNVWLEMTLAEGKNREIRKICEHVGLTVNRLIRLSFGPYFLGNLKKGEVREANLLLLKRVFLESDLKELNINI